MIIKHLNEFLAPLFVGAGLVFYSYTAAAIVNVEQAIIGQTTEGVHTSLDLLANGASGNTEKSAYKADLQSLWQHSEHTEIMQMQYSYGKSRGQVDIDSAFAHVRHRTAINATWAGEGFAQISRNPFARLAQRTLLGGGVRWVWFEEEKKSAAYLGFGVFHEQETLSSKLGTSDPADVRLWRSNSYFVLKYQFNEQARIYSTTYYQPCITDTVDYRLLEQAALLVKLTKGLDLKLSLDVAYDSMPAQTVQKKDIVYSTGLQFRF